MPPKQQKVRLFLRRPRPRKIEEMLIGWLEKLARAPPGEFSRLWCCGALLNHRASLSQMWSSPLLNPHRNIHGDMPGAFLEKDEVKIEAFSTTGEQKVQNILKRRPVEQGRGPSCSGLVLWPMAWETFHGEMDEWIQLNSNKFWKQT